MSTECIHGLDEDLCDICHPAPVPVARPRASVARTATRRSASPRATAPRTSPRGTASRASSPSSTSSARRVSLTTQRVYHLTHIDNLSGILAAEAVYPAGFEDLDDGLRTLDIATPEARARRAATDVAGQPADGYVPFFLTPDARSWRAMRLGVADGRIAVDATGSKAYDYVMLVGVAATVAGDAEALLADGDVTLASTRTARGAEEAERMLRRLGLDEGHGLLDAEFLVAGEIPVARFTLIGVANDGARAAVRDALAGSAWRPKVAVYPPWFRRPAD